MIILNIICKVMLISQGSLFRVCKIHNVILLILLTLLEKLATLLNLLKIINNFKKFHLGSSPGVPCAPYAYDIMYKIFHLQ